MRWVRVHKLADYAYFNHAAHVHAGVGCVSCHGRIDQMEVVHQEKPLSMGWCLDCHRNPGPHLRPLDEVTNMRWAPPPASAELAAQRDRGAPHPPADRLLGVPPVSVDYWRSLGELESCARVAARPASASSPRARPRRRTASPGARCSTLLGASLSLAGLAACRRPVENIVPYVQAPGGHAARACRASYATTMPFGGSALGLLVESHEGRPTKVEGNELHPATPRRVERLGAGRDLRPLRSRPLAAPCCQARRRATTWKDFVDRLEARSTPSTPRTAATASRSSASRRPRRPRRGSWRRSEEALPEGARRRLCAARRRERRRRHRARRPAPTSSPSTTSTRRA